MSVIVVTPPVPFVSLGMAKSHLRVGCDNFDEDDIISVYISAAQAMVDGPFGKLGRCVGQQTLEYRFNGFVTPIWAWSHDTGGIFWSSADNFGSNAAWPSGRIELPFPELISVTSVTYEDSAGVVQTLPSASYLATDEGIDASFGTYFPSGRWEANAVKIRYLAGYATVPAPIISAVLLMVGDLYNNRETTLDARKSAVGQVPMSTTVENLLAPYRVWA